MSRPRANRAGREPTRRGVPRTLLGLTAVVAAASLVGAGVSLVVAATPAASSRRGRQAAGPETAEDVGDDIDAVRRQIQGLESRLRELSRRRAGIVEEFEATDVELALKRQELHVLEERARLLRQDIDDQSAEVERLAGELAAARETLRERVVQMYRMGPFMYGRMLFEVDEADDVAAAYQIVTYLAARDDELIRRVRDRLGSLAAARTEVGDTEDELATVVADAETAVEALEERQAERRRLLQQIDRETEAGRIALESARRNALELEALMDRLARAPGTGATLSFAASRGSLAWPVEGEVTGAFGRRRHPVYDTFTVSKGIEISAPEGSTVGAVFGGRVVFADWFTGYGLVVILEHGEEYFTLYGHLADVVVQVGENVVAGERLGTVGDTGSLTGVNLYFEIREGADALNPTLWLSPR